MEQTQASYFEVIIAGGSYAGLSAAMALGRSLRKVLVIDAGKPCNRQTPHSHNFITHDGETPATIAAKAKEQVLGYNTIHFENDTITEAKQTFIGFEIQTASGKTFHAKKLLFATGIFDVLPITEGFRDCWGISILHCPYCHGYEVRRQRTGIIANGEMAIEYAKLLSNWTKELFLLTNGTPDFSEQQELFLEKYNIPVYQQPIKRFEHRAGVVSKVIFIDDSDIKLSAVYHRPAFQQNSALPSLLGCEFTPDGFIQVDGMQKTSVPGLFAAGDNATRFRSVAEAVAAGNRAGAVINKELIEESFNK